MYIQLRICRLKCVDYSFALKIRSKLSHTRISSISQTELIQQETFISIPSCNYSRCAFYAVAVNDQPVNTVNKILLLCLLWKDCFVIICWGFDFINGHTYQFLI